MGKYDGLIIVGAGALALYALSRETNGQPSGTGGNLGGFEDAAGQGEWVPDGSGGFVFIPYNGTSNGDGDGNTTTDPDNSTPGDAGNQTFDSTAGDDGPTYGEGLVEGFIDPYGVGATAQFLAGLGLAAGGKVLLDRARGKTEPPKSGPETRTSLDAGTTAAKTGTTAAKAPETPEKTRTLIPEGGSKPGDVELSASTSKLESPARSGTQRGTRGGASDRLTFVDTGAQRSTRPAVTRSKVAKGAASAVGSALVVADIAVSADAFRESQEAGDSVAQSTGLALGFLDRDRTKAIQDKYGTGVGGTAVLAMANVGAFGEGVVEAAKNPIETAGAIGASVQRLPSNAQAIWGMLTGKKEVKSEPVVNRRGETTSQRQERQLREAEEARAEVASRRTRNNREPVQLRPGARSIGR